MKHRLAPLLEGMEMGKSEHDWLEQRLESMTAKEELLFRGAMQIESPRDIQTTIQILQGLDHYQLLYGAEDDVLLTVPAFAAGGDVAGAVEQTWDDAATQIKTVVDNVVFPALSMILAIAFFVKLGMSYFDYRTRGQFEWTGPAILFVCLIFVLLAPNYIWGIIGISESKAAPPPN